MIKPMMIEIPAEDTSSVFLRNINIPDTHEVRQFQEGMAALENWGVFYLFLMLKKEGLFRTTGDIYHIEDIYYQLEALPKYISFIESILDLLCEFGYLVQVQSKIFRCAMQLPNTDLHAETLEQIISQYPSIKPNADFLYTSLNAYFPVIRGKDSFLNVMFPKGSLDIIENIYKRNPDSIYFNKIVKEWVRCYLTNTVCTKKNQVKILEVGAGIGSTSEHVLPTLLESNQCSHYVYTDVSKAFTRYAENHFGSKYSFLSFTNFDIQKCPILQNIQPKSYDIIIATNVLHIAKDINTALQNITQLLKPNGMLVINEGIRKGHFATLAYGLTDGWWAFQDKERRVPGSPFINLTKWKELLTEHGYKKIQSMNELLKPDIHIIQDVISANL